MNVPIIYRFRGVLDLGRLNYAVSSLVKRHESLRTGFSWREPANSSQRELEQIIYAPEAVDVHVSDVSAEPDPYSAARAIMDQYLRQDADVSSGRPFTADLFRLTPDDHIFMLKLHHIVTDAWSNDVIRRDFRAYYNNGEMTDLEPPKWTFRDYVQWRQERLGRRAQSFHEPFWRKELAKAQPLSLRLSPAGEPLVRESRRIPVTDTVRFAIPDSDIAALRDLAARKRCTLFTVMLGLFFAAVHLECDVDNIAVGAAMANRSRRELYNVVGTFANLAVIGATWEKNPRFDDVLAAVRHSALEVLGHQEYPFLNVLTDETMAKKARRVGRVNFNMLALPDGMISARNDNIGFHGLVTESLPIPPGMNGRFELDALIFPQDGAYWAEYRYATDRFDRGFVEDIAERYRGLVRLAIADPAAPLTKSVP
jgi:condensation domain-containing protein